MKLLTLALAAALSLAAQNRARLDPGLNTIQAATLQADLMFLSSDALEGRMSLERGDEAAIQWIASEFSKAGLKPLSGDSFLQPVPLIEYKMDRENTFAALRIRGVEQIFHAPDATASYPNDG